MKKILKWTAMAIGAALLGATAYVALNSFDCEPPDMAIFTNHFDPPSEADNVYFGLMAAANVPGEKAGVPALTSVFSEHEGTWRSIDNHKNDVNAEERDAILAEGGKVLSLFHEAVHRKAWCAVDQTSGKRILFPSISAVIRMCRLVRLNAERHLERGEVGLAIEDARDIVLLVRKVEHDAETAVTGLMAFGVLGCADSIAMKIVGSGKATDEELERLQDALRQFDMAARPERVQRMLNNDFTEFFRQMMDDMATGQVNISASELGECSGFNGLGMCALRIPLVRSYAFQNNRTWTIYANYLAKVKEGYRLGYDKTAWDKLDEELSAMLDDDGSWCLGPNFVGKRIVKSTIPAWRAIGEAIARTSFQHSGVETVVAAARFKRKSGGFPKALAELVPEFLQAVPHDPFASAAEIKYDAERGIVWTVGREGSFNGETVEPRADGKRAARGKENRNYVLNIAGSPAK